MITPDNIPHEGEESSEVNAERSTGNINDPNINGKRPIGAVEIPNEENKQKTREKRINYKYLNDPFPDKEEAAKVALVASKIPEPI